MFAFCIVSFWTKTQVSFSRISDVFVGHSRKFSQNGVRSVKSGKSFWALLDPRLLANMGSWNKSKIQTQPTTANEPNDQEQKTERQKTYTLTINQQRRREYNILSILLLLE